MTQLDWEDIKVMIGKQLHIPDDILDYIATADILQLCASGCSIYTISRFTNLELPYVVDVITKTLKFKGWDKDLDYNPYQVFKTCDGNFDSYLSELKILRPNLTDSEIGESFLVSNRYNKIDIEMEKFWI